MSTRTARLVPLLILCFSVFASSLAWAAGQQAEAVPGEILVGVSPSNDTPAFKSQVVASVGQEMGHHAALHVHRVKLKAGLSIEKAIAQLSQRADVLYAEPNYILRAFSTPNDPGYASQYAPNKVQANLAWDLWQPQGQIVIAIVDTGIDTNHPDLTNKILRNGGVVVGFNFVNNTTNATDDHGHGTHCAGIAAAEINNAVGVAGIAGWNGLPGSDTSFIKLMPVKVLSGSGSGTTAGVAQGIEWAANNGAKVISLSLGGGGSTTLQNAVNLAWSKGCVVVAAAGNSGSSLPSYPGAYANALSVAATDSGDTLASFSNYGSWVQVAAPGVSIYSTLPTYAAGGGFGTNYGTLSGTSMATPLVAGEAALVWAQNPSLTNADIKSILKTNVDPYNPYAGRTIAAGAGRVNVLKALQAAGNTTPQPPGVPGNLTATGGNAQVSLSWLASANAATYNVKRSDTSGGPYATLANGVTTTTYLDTTVTNGSTYYYVVSASNSLGESADSNEASATPVAPPPVSQLLGNPGFENGSANPAPWVVTAGVIDSSVNQPARSGAWKAWLDGYGTTHTDTLYQDVTIPANATTATLSFYLHIDTQETTLFTAYDTLKVQVRNTAGALLKQLASYSNLNRNTGYAKKTFDLSAYRGQTIRIYLVGQEDFSLATSFVVDDFSLIVQ